MLQQPLAHGRRHAAVRARRCMNSCSLVQVQWMMQAQWGTHAGLVVRFCCCCFLGDVARLLAHAFR